MATKKKRNSNRTKKTSQKISIRLFLGIFLLFLTVFLATALLSYSSIDPSLFQTGNGPIQNLGGKAGAYVAGFLIQNFGYSAYWSIIYCGLHGFFLLFKTILNPLKLSQIISLFFLAVVIMVLSGIFPEIFPQNSPMSEGPGGIVGNMVTIYMVTLFGLWGSLILLFPFCATAILVLFRLSIIEYIETKQ
jgi:DNA segregation ATPase FtsK/SpoIIIE, S-DNA-T family